ncbi:hypothetical protein MicloDRAFT_00057530 [Microvirga lotononidis]|uniref:Uncharacterized protein n=1 Tax=Microvirga lotononidis TaxID=864069 RepID=I4YM41_9HYPH|nr:hypothetical protein MicloDRAFT_00057530 [Microvirga lotononidis]
MVAFRYAIFCNPIICNYVNNKFGLSINYWRSSHFGEGM